MRIDLHTHSNRSDGTDTPRELMFLAAEAGLDVIGLADHDSTAGWAEAAEAAEEAGIRLVRAIEVSAELEGQSVHLLAYEPDPENEALLKELDKVIRAREGRIQATVDRLAEHDIHLTIEDVYAQATSTAALGRPHVADAMVAHGYAPHRDEAFAKWLAHGKPAFVDKYSIDLRQAIRLVRDAGGVPVVAHALARDSASVMTDEIFEELADLGLAGIEVDHVDHGPAERARLTEIADRLGLVKTGSSDYHGSGKGAAFVLGANTTDPEEFDRLLS